MSLDSLITEIADIPHTNDPDQVRRMSRDMTEPFSPILGAEVRAKLAELVVIPRSKDDVVRTARAAARHHVPIMARGAGTANWGQGIPMAGGIVLDMTQLTQIRAVKDRKIRVEPGAIIQAVDHAAQAEGQELRMHPSTRRSATIGGYIAGGHVGIGSVRWGILRDRGNICAVEVVSVEEEPRVVELRGPDVNLVHHAYGTNGIITEIEMPLAPAYRWREAIVDFADFMAATRFAFALAASDGMVVKMASVTAWPYPSYFRQLGSLVREGRHAVQVMIADEFADNFAPLVAAFDGFIAYQGLEGQGPFNRPLYEFNFGHARLHVTRIDADLITNIGIFPWGDVLGSIERVYAKFLSLGPLRLDLKRIDGNLTCQGSPLFKFRDAAHLAEVIEGMQAEGVMSANTHTMHVQGNGMKPIDDAERTFKRAMDPLGLMNPGKFTAEETVSTTAAGANLPTSGWTYRKVG